MRVGLGGKERQPDRFLAIRFEKDAQRACEDFVKETNGTIEAKSTEIADKFEFKAKKETVFVEAKEAKKAVMSELEHLSKHNAEIHQSRDFVMKNFAICLPARAVEIEALK